MKKHHPLYWRWCSFFLFATVIISLSIISKTGIRDSENEVPTKLRPVLAREDAFSSGIYSHGSHAKVRSASRNSAKSNQNNDENYPRELWKILNSLDQGEASRCRTVLEKKVNGATCYYLECRPPSTKEIDQTRRLVHEILNNTSPDKKSEMDRAIGELIKEYDPFGQSGKKLISIRIPDDPLHPLSAWTYPTNDVEREVERLFSGQEISAPGDMQFYVGDKSNSLFRFRNLIVQP